MADRAIHRNSIESFYGMIGASETAKIWKRKWKKEKKKKITERIMEDTVLRMNNISIYFTMLHTHNHKLSSVQCCRISMNVARKENEWSFFFFEKSEWNFQSDFLKNFWYSLSNDVKRFYCSECVHLEESQNTDFFIFKCSTVESWSLVQ